MVDAVAAAQQPSPAPSNTPAGTSASAPAATGGDAGSDMFHSVLSALNPLQYLPVVGTIYRSVTGDEVAEPVRRVGSAIGSFLMGGPIGLALNLAAVGAEKVLGFDFDKFAQGAAQGVLHTVAAGLGLGGGGGPDATTGTRLAWTPAQLSAYGVSTQADGTLTRGDVSGAEVLNTLEMSRIERVKLAATGSVGLFA